MAYGVAKNLGSGALPSIGFAFFAIVLLAVFFSNRSADAGRLSELIGNLGGGPLFGFDGFRDSVFGTAAAAAVGISWFGLGGFVSGFFRIDAGASQSRLLGFVQHAALGAAIWSLTWFLIGLAGGYSAGMAIGLTLAGLALAIWNLAAGEKPKNETAIGEKSSLFDKTIVVLIAVPLILAFIASIAPPIAKDTLLYHFAVPKAFIAQGSNAFIDGNIASYLALGTEMHAVWAMLLGGTINGRAAEIAAGVTLFLFLPLLLMAIYGWSREVGISRTWALLAVLTVAAVPTAFHVASSGYIDIALALFVTLAIRSLSRWWKDLESGSLVMIAIFLGAALALKLTALFVVAAFALVILLRARDEKDNSAKLAAVGLTALIFAGAIASPWYLRTWQATGSPVFPFYMSIWKGEATGWDIERSSLFQVMNSQYGGANKSAADYLMAPWNLSVAAQPEVAEKFDGVLGIAFLLGLPILIFGLWKFDLPIEARIGAGVAGIMFLFWLFSSQQLRYLLPLLPVLAIAISAAGEKVSIGKNDLKQAFQYGFIAAGLAGILVTAAWFCQKAPLRVAAGGESRDEYLTRNLDYYSFYKTLNTETATDDKVWL
ncbi:MAG: hypothetical protein ABIV48_07405, partial [Pyrinomonadaceae bacterium]